MKKGGAGFTTDPVWQLLSFYGMCEPIAVHDTHR